MKAIIMAGGEGTRLKAVTGDTPKPMALLAGRPLLEHILYLLKENGFDSACLALHYRPEVIRDYLGDGRRYGMRLEYRIETEQRGTAGGVRACADYYGTEAFLVISGDCACDFDLRSLMEEHRSHPCAVTLALHPHETPLQYGTVLTDRTGRVVSFIEKPEWERVVTDLVNTGVYVISPEAMEFVPTDGRPCDFARDLFPALMEAGLTIRGVPMEGYWCDIGTPASFHQCNLDALEGKLRLASPPLVQPRPARKELRAVPRTGTVREYPCAHRARVMRELSRYAMEAGTGFDFRDGLTLSSADGWVRIAPSPERDALTVSAEAPDREKADSMLQSCEALLNEVERDLGKR